MEENMEKREKKNRKVLKIIGIIILILLLILLIYFIRNFVIVNSFAEIQSSNNYHYKFTKDDGSFEYSYKDGKSVEIFRVNDQIASIDWYDKNTRERIYVEPLSSKATISHIQNHESGLVGSLLLETAISDNVSGRLNKAFCSFITTENIDGVECYKLQPWCGVLSNTFYFNKDSKLMEKAIIGNSDVNFSDWTINQLTDEDVARPDLSNYEIIEEE